MSQSVESSLIIGIKISDLLTEEVKIQSYEIHDRRGNPTGEFEKEYIKKYYFKNKPEEKFDLDLSYLDDYPNEKDFGVHVIDYESDDRFSNIIIGIALKRTDNIMYNGNVVHEIPFEEILDVKKTVQMEIYSRYGINVESKVYLTSTVSC